MSREPSVRPALRRRSNNCEQRFATTSRSLLLLAWTRVAHQRTGSFPPRFGGPTTRAILSVEEGYVAATQAYAILFATARILCEPEVCDLAERHLTDHVEGLRVLGRMLPGALARELNADGLFCRCVCPSCGIGACGCVRASIAAVAEAWGWPGLPIGDGIELRSPPRPGSQLAAAGIHEGDWIVSVDGTQVRSNQELQAALRSHQIGEMAQLRIRHSTGEHSTVAISHVSDWP